MPSEAHDLRTIGGRLTRAREDQQIKTQDALAKRLRAEGYTVTRPTVTRWEDGVHLPKQEVWPYLEKVLQVQMRNIFFGAEKDEDPDEHEFLDRMRGFYRALDPRGRRAVIGLAQQQIRDIEDERVAAARIQREAETLRATLPLGGERLEVSGESHDSAVRDAESS